MTKDRIIFIFLIGLSIMGTITFMFLFPVSLDEYYGNPSESPPVFLIGYQAGKPCYGINKQIPYDPRKAQNDLEKRRKEKYWNDVRATTGRGLVLLLFDWDNNGKPDYDNYRVEYNK